MPNFLGSTNDALITETAGDYIMELNHARAVDEYSVWCNGGLEGEQEMMEANGMFSIPILMKDNVLLNTMGIKVGATNDGEDILIPKGPMCVSKAGGILPISKLQVGTEVRQVACNRRALVARTLKQVRKMNRRIKGQHTGGLFVFCGTYPTLVPDQMSTLCDKLAATFQHPGTPFMGIFAAGEQGRCWVAPEEDEEEEEEGDMEAKTPSEAPESVQGFGDDDEDDGGTSGLLPKPIHGMMLAVGMVFGERNKPDSRDGAGQNGADGEDTGAVGNGKAAALAIPAASGANQPGGSFISRNAMYAQERSAWKLKGRHAAFLSHFKRECAMEAR